VIRRAQHLPEARLLDCYLNERDGTAVDPRVAEHLTDCEPCGARYAELTRFMDTLRSDAGLEADHAFTPERLRLQREQIARRLEHVNRPGRVITFPSRIGRRGMTVSTARVAPRWTAAAAAAGLFAGVALGAAYQWDGAALRRRVGREVMAARPAPAAPVLTHAGAAQVGADDAFMLELEVAIDRPRTRELIAIDAFTPHFREIRTER
jgi:hypothetical protein